MLLFSICLDDVQYIWACSAYWFRKACYGMIAWFYTWANLSYCLSCFKNFNSLLGGLKWDKNNDWC